MYGYGRTASVPAADEEYELRAPSEERLYSPEHDAAVIAWRAGCFEALGFAAYVAGALALRRDVDREYVTRLIRGGATHEQVTTIVL